MQPIWMSHQGWVTTWLHFDPVVKTLVILQGKICICIIIWFLLNTHPMRQADSGRLWKFNVWFHMSSSLATSTKPWQTQNVEKVQTNTHMPGPWSELGMDLLCCSRLRIASREDVPDSKAAVFARVTLCQKNNPRLAAGVWVASSATGEM